MSLIELVISVAIAGAVFTVVMSLGFYSAQSFAAMSSYVELSASSRQAVDSLTREIRQADLVSGCSDGRLDLQVTSLSNLTYAVSYIWDPTSKTLSRAMGSNSQVYLSGCDYIRFAMFQRNGTTTQATPVPTSDPASCKAVQLSWSCSRQIFGDTTSTEDMQSAMVVLRKQ
jgi:Tfp pilus assembly protein PilW